jgi:hypothetical protein
VTIKPADKNPGISDSDLHLYINWYNGGGNYIIDQAIYCVLNGGPRFGVIRANVNHYYIRDATQTTSKHFDSSLRLWLKYVTKLLGFSYNSFQYWYKPGTQTFYGLAGLSDIVGTMTIRGLTNKYI